MNQTQREIKFKLRLHNEKKMMDWKEVNDIMPLALYQHRKGVATLLQYTGLKDKNGKEIYEGDIVSISGMGNCRVVWYSFGWAFENKDNIMDFSGVIMEGGVHRVIGNIYENPELQSD